MKALILYFFLHAASAAPTFRRISRGGGWEGRIIGGTPADRGAWPWQASLQRGSQGHNCGGVLITPDIILTAAHCMQGGYVDVLLGANYNIPGADGELYPTVAARMHEMYNPMNGHANDIAMVLLAYPANPQNPLIRTVNLPPAPGTPYQSGCFISGWGRTESGGPSSVLMQAAVGIFDQSTCNLAMDGVIGDYHICVSGNGAQGACFGDSGGPLSCQGASGWEVAGVTSWGVPDCNPQYPSIYARVSYFLGWIHGVKEVFRNVKSRQSTEWLI